LLNRLCSPAWADNGEVWPDVGTAEKNSNRDPEAHRNRASPSGVTCDMMLLPRKPAPSRRSPALP
jgi:hypothetical protein